MPKLTSGITQKERLEVIQSIDVIKSALTGHEKEILQRYRQMVAREFSQVQSRLTSSH
jgi:glycerol-3-phosphate cytidylyltransferase-like family protein